MRIQKLRMDSLLATVGPIFRGIGEGVKRRGRLRPT